ncbi:MAG: site-specific integrase [Alphaproteobacteria bacterium]|nr:site-specific integrase [Alphaproteobacteria bacterium]MBM3654022.1 site-specific integrase [Alphaproteobacteria bacterium]
MRERIGKLTKRTVDAAAPEAERYILWDSALKGFGLRIEPSGTKTFLVRYRAAGRKRFVAVGRFGQLTPEQARGLAQETLADVRRGRDPADERRRERAALSVADLAARFLDEHVRAKRKSSTAVHYRSLIDCYLLPKHGARKAHDFARADLARLHLSLQDRPYQANRLLAVVASMYSFGERHGLISEGHNPAMRIERFPEARRERFLSTEELGRLGEAFRQFENDGRFGTGIAALRLLLFTGARLREILHLRWKHVDFERGLLLLPDSKTGRRTITLNAPSLAVLQSLDRIGPFVIGGANPDIPRADLKKPWTAVTKAASLPGLRIHDLRHSFASIGAGAGLGLPIVGKLLGHTQAATTQRYAHLDADPIRRAADAIGATIAAALDGRAGATVAPLRTKR